MYLSNNISTYSNNRFDNMVSNQKKYSINTVEIHTTISFNIDYRYSFDHEVEKFLCGIFINQRKIHRYYKAECEYDENIINEDEFDKIEESCILSLKKENTKNLDKKLIYLYDMINKFYPEEIEYMANDDLADILGVSKSNIKKLLRLKK